MHTCRSSIHGNMSIWWNAERHEMNSVAYLICCISLLLWYLSYFKGFAKSVFILGKMYILVVCGCILFKLHIVALFLIYHTGIEMQVFEKVVLFLHFLTPACVTSLSNVALLHWFPRIVCLGSFSWLNLPSLLLWRLFIFRRPVLVCVASVSVSFFSILWLHYLRLCAHMANATVCPWRLFQIM